MKNYLSKMRGGTRTSSGVRLADMFWAAVGAFIGISAVALINYWVLEDTDMVMIIGSFGASAVLIYGTINSPMSQPRNLVGGHIFSAIVGVTAYHFLKAHIWLAAPAAVAIAIALMLHTKTLHPPGGATALIAVIGSENIHNLGYLYVLIPVGVGTLIMLEIALLVNNIPENRRYPEYWL